MASETILEMARRHVREGRVHLDRQRELVLRLEEIRSPMIEEARELLSRFEAVQSQHVTHLAQIENEVRMGRRNASGGLVVRT